MSMSADNLRAEVTENVPVSRQPAGSSGCRAEYRTGELILSQAPGQISAHHPSPLPFEESLRKARGNSLRRGCHAGSFSQSIPAQATTICRHDTSRDIHSGENPQAAMAAKLLICYLLLSSTLGKLNDTVTSLSDVTVRRLVSCTDSVARCTRSEPSKSYVRQDPDGVPWVGSVPGLPQALPHPHVCRPFPCGRTLTAYRGWARSPAYPRPYPTPMTLTAYRGWVRSPAYPRPYPTPMSADDRVCTWVISLQQGHGVKVTVYGWDLNSEVTRNSTVRDEVQVFGDGTCSDRRRLRTYTGTSEPTDVVYVPNHVACLKFYRRTTGNDIHSGFTIEYEAHSARLRSVIGLLNSQPAQLQRDWTEDCKTGGNLGIPPAKVIGSTRADPAADSVAFQLMSALCERRGK
ncbi:hypothetical protein Bbelb_230150 [Branchiostoma belcheri]|nr:hypothetical protein Bbelb_230150 [Branchiostoma belcheri]